MKLRSHLSVCADNAISHMTHALHVTHRAAVTTRSPVINHVPLYHRRNSLGGKERTEEKKDRRIVPATKAVLWKLQRGVFSSFCSSLRVRVLKNKLTSHIHKCVRKLN